MSWHLPIPLDYHLEGYNLILKHMMHLNNTLVHKFLYIIITHLSLSQKYKNNDSCLKYILNTL